MFQTLRPRDEVEGTGIGLALVQKIVGFRGGRDGLRHLSLVVLTTSDDQRDRIEAYNLNVAGYILKPVTFFSFVEAMAILNKYWTLVELP